MTKSAETAGSSAETTETPSYNKAMKSRIECNRAIAKKIAETVEKFPDWRFHQIMQNIGLELGTPDWDPWYEESETTLAQLEKTSATLFGEPAAAQKA